MEQNWDPGVKKFFVKILNSIAMSLFWMMACATAGIYFELGYTNGRPIICTIFFIDFVVRYSKAKDKMKFMKWGWIDLVSSIPMFDFLRVGRILRLIRLFRIVKAFRSTNLLIKHIFKNRGQGALASASI